MPNFKQIQEKIFNIDDIAQRFAFFFNGVVIKTEEML